MTQRQPQIIRSVDDVAAALPFTVYVEGGGVSPLLIAAFASQGDASTYARAQQSAAQAADKLDVYTLLGPQGEVEYWLDGEAVEKTEDKTP